jgi:hypothetical protein
VLIWDCAIAGGWWHLASEAPTDIFPERIGHYWVWRDDSRDWGMLFRAETSDWTGTLLAAKANPQPAFDPTKAVAAVDPRALPSSNESLEGSRAAARQAVVMPILSLRRWRRGRWATEAGVGKNSVYEYLDGKRTLSNENRKAMAEVIGLKPEDLPG